MLEVRNLTCERSGRQVFSGLAFRLPPSQVLRVSGRNGSGKSSLLRMLCGLLPVAQGEILWRANPIQSDREGFCKSLIYIGHSNGTKDDMSAVENIHSDCAIAGREIDRPSIVAALGRFGIADRANVPLRRLSQGQRRRVALSRLALPGRQTLWLLDEPFAALDAASSDTLAGLMADHVAAGGSIAFSTHVEVPIPGVDVAVVDLDQLAGHA